MQCLEHFQSIATNMEGYFRPVMSPFVIGMLLFTTVLTQDPCLIQNPDAVPDLELRGPNTVNIGLEDLFSTNTDWYSGTSNYDMVTTYDPAEQHPVDKCGSLFPVMIVGPNSTIPDNNTQQVVTVRYYNVASMTWDTTDIQVKDCGSYRMYQLKSIPMGTYCFATNANADLCVRNDIPEVQDILDRIPIIDAAFIDDSNLTTGWYKSSLLDISQPFLVDNQTFYHCGGSQPIYAESPLPADDGMVHDMNLTVFNISGGDHSNVEIQVRNCGGFRLYHLSAMVPSGASYCFDVPHSTDEAAPGYQPQVAIDIYHECVNGTERINAVCEFEPEAVNDTYFYLITWYVSGTPLQYTQQITADEREMAILTDQDLVNQGFYREVELSCGVAVRSTATGIVGEFFTSSKVFFGLKTNETSIEIEPGEFHDVVIFVNTPISCACGEEFCNIKLFVDDFSVPNTPVNRNEDMAFIVTEGIEDGEGGFVSGVIVEGQGSTPLRRRRSFSPSDGPTRLGIKIKHMFPYRTKNYITRERIPLMLRMNTNRNAFWPDGIFGCIDVRVRDRPERIHWRKKECHAVCDPHMLSFDGRKYESQDEGEFLMYKYCPEYFPHWYPNSNVNLKVHLKTVSCRGDGNIPFCPCGVAVMAGHDIYVVDTCGDTRYQGFTRCEDHILHVEATDTLVKIWLPHGTRVEARKTGGKSSFQLWNVWIYPSIHDIHSSCGLCGSLDDNCGNDCDVFNGQTYQSPYGDDCSSHGLVREFTEKFRVAEAQTLFTPLKYDNIVYINPAPFRPDSSSYCFCGHRQWPGDPVSCSCQQTHWWGDVRDTKCDEFLEIPPNPLPSVKQLFVGGTGVVVPDPATQIECDTMMAELRETFLSCRAFAEQLQNCRADLKLDPNAGTDWIENSRQILEASCQTENAAEREPVLAITNLCPLGCGDNGRCVEGECECNPGFGNSRCDTAITDQVEVLGVRDNLCNRRRLPCRSFTIKPRSRAFVPEFAYTASIDVRSITPSGSRSVFGSGINRQCTVKNFMCLSVDMPLIKPSPYQYYRYGTRSKRSTTNEIDNGIEMEDSDGRQRRQAESKSFVEGQESFVMEYVITITTDNVTYSDPVSAFSFDATCVGYVDNGGGDVTFFIKPSFCFLDFECVPNGTYHITDWCRFCHTDRNPTDWTVDLDQAECIEVKLSKLPDPVEQPLSIAVIACISAAVLVVLIVVAVFILYRIYRKTIPKNATFAQIGHALGQKNPHFQPKEFLPEKKKHII
ncbi:uncharacterized protein LOC110446984 [Mizuhopecten yessoensis]|uniref:uncharacterized protein LOC110446984 n=1 Tax=Mizuhopecten yessoensis TaxID=6573 RepID=UPI000B45A7E9|nr:uncharacterized protein LOC110446984 [Mizuhopecten yessoensis]